MSFDLSKYKTELGTHQQQNVIWISFPNDRKLINDLRAAYSPARWSATQRSWYLPDVKNYRLALGLPPASLIGKEVVQHIHPVNLPAFEQYQHELLLRGFSPNTFRTYTIQFAQLLYLIKSFPVQNLSPEKLRSYFLYCIQVQKIAENHLSSRINAVKFYFEKILKQEKFFFDIPRPKKPSLLPKVISTADILKLFSVVENPKHQLLLKLCYGMGLRVSEVVKLKISHIDSKRMQVLIHAAKGKKDRYVPLPEIVLDDLRKYYKAYQPKDFLFEGQYGGEYSIRSVQAVFKLAMEKAKINKSVGIHSIRHSYATHLLEYGTDMTHIQKLLGHNDIKTTQLYAHVSNRSVANVKSPLDRLAEKNAASPKS